MNSGGIAGEAVDVLGVIVAVACALAARAGSFFAMRVPPDDGGTFAGTQSPSAVRWAGT